MTPITQDQWQHRWLLRDETSQISLILKTGSHPVRTEYIRDWFSYPLTPQNLPDPTRAVRVRQKDDGPLVLSTKTVRRHGEHRTVYSHELPITMKEALGEPSIQKMRFLFDEGRLTVDVYRNHVLDGIVILEQHFNAGEAPPPLPKWTRVFNPLNVTDSLTSGHLALLHKPGDMLASQARLMERLGLAKPTIALTGAPCCGKTSIIEHLMEHAPHVHIVPEAATIAIIHLRCRPPSNRSSWPEEAQFQQFVRDIQLLFEGIGRQTAIHEQKRAVVVDRGIVDAHAYLSGDPHAAYERLFGCSVAQDLQRYHAVIHPALPPREIYEERRRNNPARLETYEQALEIDRRMTRAWSSHRHYHKVGEGMGWDEKRQAILALIDRYSH